MLLTTILNQCYRFKGFVYAQARLVRQHGQQTIEVQVSGHGNAAYAGLTWPGRLPNYCHAPQRQAAGRRIR